MKFPRKSLFCTGILLLSLCCTASATLVNLSSSKDTTLNQSNPDNNMGGHDNVHSGTTNGGGKRRGLFAFDLSSIPALATINSVTLTLTVPSGNTANPSTFNLHRLLTPWTEGNKTGNNGAAATAGESTWNTAGPAAWATPGALPAPIM